MDGVCKTKFLALYKINCGSISATRYHQLHVEICKNSYQKLQKPDFHEPLVQNKVNSTKHTDSVRCTCYFLELEQYEWMNGRKTHLMVC